ncbi:hypothetical protein FT663_03286 [Candidozyma haemuli var. vulneris]|nr:hypothetical protein FT663_03286 [[Candida] haemuloni var. vulneris]KAF3990535.1 hypothetical protein FT662_02220 [[Candida] haemuloni var. vulneris]
MAFSGSALFNFVVSSEPTEKKLEAVSNLKTHVKKENVDLGQVQAYFEAISVLMDSPDQGLQNTTFSLLCHLVKRVSIQDSRTTLLHDHGFLVLPIIITRIADSRASVKISAKRALEAYWLTAPSKVEQALIDSGLKNRSPLIINECVVWLNTILTEVNRHFSLNPFMNTLAEILVEYEQNALLVENVKILFANYYDLKQNRLHKFELQKILETHRVSTSLRTSIMGTDHVMKSRDKPDQSHAPVKNHAPARSHVPTRSHVPKLPVLPMVKPPKQETAYPSKAYNEKTTSKAYPETNTLPSDDKPKDELVSSSPVDSIIAGLQNYAIDTKVKPSPSKNPDFLYASVSDLMPVFEGKETERNWSKREANIASLRSLLRGNAHTDFPHELALSLKDISEGICKALLSLRTTLSVSACQLVKEAAVLLKEHFDQLLDNFAPTLIKLNASTKHMTSSNAHIAMCAILINSSYGGKLLHKIQTASSEKGSNTRSHCGTWLKIFITRSHDHGNLPHTEIIERVLGRLLSDPISPVRQSAKETFWSLQTYSPESAERLLTRLDANVVKGLERSKPSNLTKTRIDSSHTRSTRPSIKESILAKNKELVAKRAESRSNSRNASQRAGDGSDRIFGRGSSRQASDPPSSSRRPVSASVKKEKNHDEHVVKHRSFHNLRQSSAEAEEKRSLRSVASTNFTPSQSASKDAAPKVISTSDPIFQFLSSSNETTIREGISLLKYAMIVDEIFPDEMKFYLRKVSLTHPECLRPLIDNPSEIFDKTWSLMTPEDMLRLCSIILPVTEEMIDRMVRLCDQDIYQSVGTLFSYIADFDIIVGEKHLAMQVIKYKPKILELLVQFTIRCVARIPVNEASYYQLSKPLFDLVALFHSTPSYDKYKCLVVHLFETDSLAFKRSLSSSSPNCVKEIENIVGIEEKVESPSRSIRQSTDEFNKSMTGTSATGLSPINDDFATIVPTTEKSLPVPQHSENLPSEDYSGNNVTIRSTDNVEVRDVEPEKSPRPNTSDSTDAKEMTSHGGSITHDTDVNNTRPSVGDDALIVAPIETIVDSTSSVDDKSGSGSNLPLEVNDFDVSSTSAPGMSEVDGSQKDISIGSPVVNEAANDDIMTSPSPEPAVSAVNEVAKLDIMTSPSPEPAVNAVPTFRSKSFSPKKTTNPNVFASGSVTPMRNEFFNRLNSDPSVELVENFAQVKITNRLNSIQSFIDKVDPLSKVSCKARPISIFEDTKVSGSPQKVKEYSYTELNWFNFSVARLALDKEATEFNDYTVEEFDNLCEDLKGEISGKKFVSLLRYLQNEQSAEFDRYFVQEGINKIEDSLHFHLCSSDVPDKLSGLIILKQLLINRENINFSKLWRTLVELSDDEASEVDVAINEAFDEALCGIFSSGDMIQIIVKTLSDHATEWSDAAITYMFRCLFKLISQKTMVLAITDDLLNQLHDILKGYIGHKSVEVRKNVVQTYGKLVRAARVSELTENNIKSSSTTKESKLVEDILESLTGPQRKMVEYYSH